MFQPECDELLNQSSCSFLFLIESRELLPLGFEKKYQRLGHVDDERKIPWNLRDGGSIWEDLAASQLHPTTFGRVVYLADQIFRRPFRRADMNAN